MTLMLCPSKLGSIMHETCSPTSELSSLSCHGGGNGRCGFQRVLAAPALGGAVTQEPLPDDGAPALRLRRVYVYPDARRRGVGRTLASALIQEGLDSVRRLTVHTDDAHAEAFWRAQGFALVSGKAWNLEFRG